MVYCFAKQLMCCVIYCAFVYSSSADVKEVKLTFYKFQNEKKCGAKPIDVEIGKSFQVYIDPSGEYLHAVARCSFPLASPGIQEIFFKKDDKKSVYISELFESGTKPGGWDLKCRFYTNNCEKFIDSSNSCQYWNVADGSVHYDQGVLCSTKIHVHASGESYVIPSGVLEVNGNNITEDNGQYVHHFYEEEGTTFRCHKTNGSKVELRYTSSLGKVISTDYQNESVSMYMKLRGANAYGIVECIATDEEKKRFHNVTLRLDKQGIREMLNFNVNGSILPQTKRSSNEYHYVYKFFDGESITVSVVMDQNMYEEVVCDGVGSERIKKILNISKPVEFVSFDVKETNDGDSISCVVKKKGSTGEGRKKNSVEADAGETNETVNISLHFSIQKPDYSPFLSGISRSNILLQYSNNTSNMVEYAVENSVPLSLVCSSKNENASTTWIHGDNPEKYEKEPLFQWSSTNLPPAKPITIKCKANSTTEDKISNLVLVQKKAAPNSYNPTFFTTPQVNPAAAEASTINPKPAGKAENNSETEKDNNPLFFIAASVAVVLLVVAVILWVAIKKRKTILQNKSSTMDYQNLPEHREGPMATPAQWDRPDPTYADPNSVDHLYSKPIPKSIRNKLNPTYSEPKDTLSKGIRKKVNHTYSEPINSLNKHTYQNTQQIKNEPTYASVQNNEPGYASVQNSEPAYASVQNNDPTYASIQNNEPAYASVQNNEPAYTSVQNNEPTYASIQNNEPTYASVQNNEPTYASVQNNEPTYAPAYANQNTLEYQNVSTLKKEDTYANIGKKSDNSNSKGKKVQNQAESSGVNYADVCTEYNGNRKYVNAHVKNNVEPAYCEINMGTTRKK